MSILDDLGVSNIFNFGRAIYKKKHFLLIYILYLLTGK